MKMVAMIVVIVLMMVFTTSAQGNSEILLSSIFENSEVSTIIEEDLSIYSPSAERRGKRR